MVEDLLVLVVVEDEDLVVPSVVVEEDLHQSVADPEKGCSSGARDFGRTHFPRACPPLFLGASTIDTTLEPIVSRSQPLPQREGLLHETMSPGFPCAKAT